MSVVGAISACSSSGSAFQGECREGAPSNRVIDLQDDVLDPLSQTDVVSPTGSLSTVDGGTTLRVGVPVSEGAGALCETAREIHEITKVPVLAVLEELVPATP